MADDNSSLPEEIVEAVALAGVNSVAQQPAALSNLMLSNLVQNTNQSQQNAVSNQQNVNGIEQAILGKAVDLLIKLGPLEGMSAQQLLTGNAAAGALADLKGTLAAFAGDPAGPAAPSLRRRTTIPGRTRTHPITRGTVFVRPGPSAEDNVNIVIEEAKPQKC
jgi:hypothetical protein